MEWTDFSGGFTDDVYTDDVSKCSQNVNLLIDRNRKTYMRPGSNLYYSAAPQHPNGANRIGRFMKFNDETSLFAQSGTLLAYDSGSAWTTLTGLGGHAAFPANATSNYVSWAYWNSQYFMTSDLTSTYPIRVFKDSGGTWRLITAGLPAMVEAYSPAQATQLASAITLANSIRTALIAHFADASTHGGTRTTHRVADTTSGAGIGAAATDLTTLLRLTGELLRAYQLHYNDEQTSILYHYKIFTAAERLATGYVVGVENLPPIAAPTDSLLASTEIPTTLQDAIPALNDIRSKYHTHGGRLDVHGDPNNGDINLVATAPLYGQAYGPLIDLDRSAIYAYLNRVKSVYNVHIAAAASAAWSHTTADATNPISVANATTPDTFEALLYSARAKYTNHELDAEKAAAWSYHRAKFKNAANLSPKVDLSAPYSGEVGYPDFFGGVRAGNWEKGLFYLNELKTKYNIHASDVTTHWVASATVANPFVMLGTDMVLADYLYAFHFQYDFTVGTIANTIVGPVLEVPAFNVLATTVQGLAISNIPSLANTAATNYDTGVITVQIYRTTDGGNTFYNVGHVTNGTTTFTDVMTDAELITQPRIYINGGVVDHDPPPISSCVHVTNNTGYYGNIIDTGESFPNRIRQSVQGSPDACPGDFFDDLEDAVVGISSVKTVPIVGCTHSIYRLDGAFNEKGAGLITHQALSNTVGLVSEASLVRVDNGVFFAGTDGFYFTDGYNLTKLSDNWNTTYKGIISTTTKAKNIQGTYDSLNRRIWWACQLNSSSSDNDGFVILDLNFPFEKPCWSSAGNYGNFFPAAALFYGSHLIRGFYAGYIFKHDDTLTTDPYVDTVVTPANWGTKTIIFDWESTFVCWGLTNIRKWCPLIEWNQQDDSNINVQPVGYNDNDRSTHVFTPFKSHTHYVWGDETIVWGDDLLLWNYHGNFDEKRYVPAGSLRCTYKKIQFTNAYVDIIASTNKGPATVDTGAKTVTLNTALEYWPLDCETYSIYFEYDNYATPYPILRKNSTTVPTVITVAETFGALTAGSWAWKIMGYQKNQKFHLLDATLWGKPLSASQTGARSP